MIVPRSFAGHGIDLSEKSQFGNKTAGSRTSSRSRSPFSLSSSPKDPVPIDHESRSSPVRIPSRGSKDFDQPSCCPSSVPVEANIESTTERLTVRPRQESVHDVLSSTAIPVRRKIRGRASQRLPKCNHVTDFSRLMQDDIRSKDGSPSKSFSNSYMDVLFGNIDGLVEGQMIVGSEGVDESILATRSISSESLASLGSPDDYSSSGLWSDRSSLGRSYETKRMRNLASSQDCATDHPLMSTEGDDDQADSLAPLLSSSPLVTPMTTEKKSRSFKSSLTASLKAIRSAAQSVSSKASLFSSQDSEEFVARSFFDFQPFLTDDKRPPPANSPPSPQLRRYLNPNTSTAPPDSPAHLHFWQDERNPLSPKQSKKSKFKSRRRALMQGNASPSSIDSLPPVVQLSMCLPPSIRTANASSPPIWLNPDGTPSNKQTAIPLLHDSESPLDSTLTLPRHREPRENRDFLRIFVCEMEMRRHGKLNDDTSTGRARLWLPPITDNFRGSTTSTVPSGEDTCDTGNGKQGAERWKSWSADDL